MTTVKTKAKGRTAQASVPIALAMIAGRLESSAAIVRQAEAQAKGVILPTNLAHAATAIEDDARALRAVAERASEGKPVMLHYGTLAGPDNSPRRETRSIMTVALREIEDIPAGTPAYDRGFRSMIYLSGGTAKNPVIGDLWILSTDSRDVLVARIEGKPNEPDIAHRLAEVVHELLNDSVTHEARVRAVWTLEEYAGTRGA